MKMPKFKLRDTVHGQVYWRFEADNGEVICTSETYTSKQSALQSIRLVQRAAPAAQVADETAST